MLTPQATTIGAATADQYYKRHYYCYNCTHMIRLICPLLSVCVSVFVVYTAQSLE
jgi:hypothetical protein